MTPLAIIVSSADRAGPALTLAAAAAALGRPVAMLFDGTSVTAFAAEPHAVTTALELGVTITACQSGLAITGQSAAALPAGITAGGMLGFLRAADGAQWLLA